MGKRYGFTTKVEAEANFWHFVRQVTVGVALITFIFLSGVIFVCTLSGCTFNFASDRQPAVVIYNDDTAGRME